MRTIDEIKQDIFALVREYSESEQVEKQPFHPGQRIPYCSRVYDAEAVYYTHLRAHET